MKTLQESILSTDLENQIDSNTEVFAILNIIDKFLKSIHYIGGDMHSIPTNGIISNFKKNVFIPIYKIRANTMNFNIDIKKYVTEHNRAVIYGIYGKRDDEEVIRLRILCPDWSSADECRIMDFNINKSRPRIEYFRASRITLKEMSNCVMDAVQKDFAYTFENGDIVSHWVENKYFKK